MIKNRCTDEWAKYSRISAVNGSQNYLHDEVFFQLKNQIYAGINIADKPIVSILGSDGDEKVIELKSFTRDLWRINQFDPLVGNLKANPEYYEKDEHDRFIITGSCKTRS